MNRKLLTQACGKFFAGIALVMALLFGPAGTLGYWNGWLFMALLFLPMAALGVWLFRKAPELLKKRLNTRETEPEQRRVIALSLVVFVAGFVVAGLDFRFGWSRLPVWLVAAAGALLLAAYALYARVMRENAYLSRTVEVQEGQRVVDSGPYGVVRHPMYAATILLCLAIPLVLGSVPALVLFLFYPLLIVLRVRNEEAVLEKGLPGYIEYERRVRYRVIPFVW